MWQIRNFKSNKINGMASTNRTSKSDTIIVIKQGYYFIDYQPNQQNKHKYNDNTVNKIYSKC